MLLVAYATMLSMLRKYGLRKYGLFKTLDKHGSPTNCVRLMLVYCQSGPFYFYHFVGTIRYSFSTEVNGLHKCVQMFLTEVFF